jgi:hypothetical protein
MVQYDAVNVVGTHRPVAMAGENDERGRVAPPSDRSGLSKLVDTDAMGIRGWMGADWASVRDGHGLPHPVG